MGLNADTGEITPVSEVPGGGGGGVIAVLQCDKFEALIFLSCV